MPVPSLTPPPDSILAGPRAPDQAPQYMTPQQRALYLAQRRKKQLDAASQPPVPASALNLGDM